MKTPPIPHVVRWFLILLSRPGVSHGLLGDIEEEYPLIIKEIGIVRAKLWLASQIVNPVLFFYG